MANNDLMENIYIFSGVLQEVRAGPGDLPAIPPGSSFITPGLWEKMCVQAGGEAPLIAAIPAIRRGNVVDH
jgi:hypothetical protein